MPKDLRRTAGSLFTAGLVLTAACAELPSEMNVEQLSPAFTETSAGFDVIPLQLRAAEDSELEAWGNVVVFVGTLAPPNPCAGTVALATVAVCGIIHHPGGVNITDGTLTIAVNPDAVETLRFALPPSPCLTYRVQAAAAPDLGTAGLELPAVQITFNTELGSIISSALGSSESQPGPPNNPAGEVSTTPGPPDAPPNPCLITFAGRAG